MNDIEKQLHKIQKRLRKAKKQASNSRPGARSRKKQYEEDLTAHRLAHGNSGK